MSRVVNDRECPERAPSALSARSGHAGRSLPRGRLTLRDAMKRTGPLSQPQALHVARQVAIALADLHAEGRAHGRLTPHHVVVSDEVEPGSVRLLDAGDAPGEPAAGSVYWSSPEQIAGEEPAPESDLYALAAVLFYALTGHPPFQGTPAEVARMHLSEPPPSVAGLAPHWVSPVLDALLRECLSKAPCLRRTTAADLAIVFAVLPDAVAKGPWEPDAAGRSPDERWGRPRPRRGAQLVLASPRSWASTLVRRFTETLPPPPLRPGASRADTACPRNDPCSPDVHKPLSTLRRRRSRPDPTA